MIPAPAMLILKNLPWKNIILGLLVGAVILAVGLYIRNAEQNRADVRTLKTQKQELKAANAALVDTYNQQIAVLQGSLEDRLERERTYNERIEEIETAPDSGCARTSEPLRRSIILLRDR